MIFQMLLNDSTSLFHLFASNNIFHQPNKKPIRTPKTYQVKHKNSKNKEKEEKRKVKRRWKWDIAYPQKNNTTLNQNWNSHILNDESLQFNILRTTKLIQNKLYLFVFAIIIATRHSALNIGTKKNSCNQFNQLFHIY